MKETKKLAFSPREKRRGAGPLDEAVDHPGVLRPAPERARLRLHAAEVHDAPPTNFRGLVLGCIAAKFCK